RRHDHRRLDDQPLPQGRHREVLRRRHHPQAQAPREADGRQEAPEDGGSVRGAAGGFHGGAQVGHRLMAASAAASAHLLPAALPVFPLTGSLLLPGNWLPLNVFEPRYRNMVEDAERAEPWIGMIQPFTPQQDNWPALDEPPADPELYTVGCAGRIERCEPQPDGSYHVLLKGLSRCRGREEVPQARGYRRVLAGYAEFAADLAEPDAELDPGPLL